MSEPAVERPSRPGSSAGPGREANVFQRKFGPLPGWGWALAAAVAAGGYLWWRNRQSASSGAADLGTPAAGDQTGEATDFSGELGTIQSEVQQLQQTEAGEEDQGTAKPGKQPKLARHVSDGKETLNQIARRRRTSVAHILAVSLAAPENRANLNRLDAWAKHPSTKRKGVVYYTSGP